MGKVTRNDVQQEGHEVNLTHTSLTNSVKQLEIAISSIH